MTIAYSESGQLSVQANQNGGFDFVGDCSLVDVSPLGQQFTLAYKSSLWFAPQYTLTNASASAFECSERDGETIVNFVTRGDGVHIGFVHWWHRPIWWMRTQWARLKKRW